KAQPMCFRDLCRTQRWVKRLAEAAMVPSSHNARHESLRAATRHVRMARSSFMATLILTRKGVREMINNTTNLELKYEMDEAITKYISFCTGTDAPEDVDYSAINQDVDDAIEMLGGVPAVEF